MQDTHTTDIFQNQFIEEPEAFKAPLVAMMSTRDVQCFDHRYYRTHNHDLQPFTDEQLWHHFRHSGQFEPRPVRYACVRYVSLGVIVQMADT